MGRSLGEAFDLLAAYRAPGHAFFERGGLGVAAFGEAEAVGPHDAVEALRAGPTGVRAVGALPFEGEGTLRIHRSHVVRSADGTELIGDEPDGGFERAGPSRPSEPFSHRQVTERPSPRSYAKAVGEAVGRIRAGDLRKVVLARTIEVEAGRELDPRRLAHRLRAVDPHAYTFAVPAEGGVLVGASPELLVSRRGTEVRCNPLAGSAPRAGDRAEDRANADRLMGSMKDREEHAIVVEAIVDALRPLCDEFAADPEPVLLETPNIWHLSTRVRGRLRAQAPSALDLALLLHPTPAIGGSPTDAALAVIEAAEPFRRGAYSGPVGWVDAHGDGEWAIALRCALLEGDRATLFAGAGVVADSDPDAEVDETDRKFRAFLDALRWG